MSNKKIKILMADGESNFSLKTLRCLTLVPNFETIVLSPQQWDPIRFSRHHAGFHRHNATGFDEKRLEVIIELTKKLKPDIIFPVEHNTIRLLSAHREELAPLAALPPMPSPEAIDIAGDKWLLTSVLKQEGIPFPDTVFVEKDKPIPEDELKRLDYPVLLKPLGYEGGGGIVFLNNFNELVERLNKGKRLDNIIVQSFINGYDIDCSILSVNGEIKAYTIQKGLAPGTERFRPPSVLEFVREDELVVHIRKLARALNWSGVAHVDLRYDSDKRIHRIIEVNPRFWASVPASASAGINFPYLICLLALKQDFEKPEYKQIRYVKPEVLAKLMLKKYFRGDATINSPTKSGLVYILSDPGPEIVQYTQKFFAKIAGLPT